MKLRILITLTMTISMILALIGPSSSSKTKASKSRHNLHHHYQRSKTDTKKVKNTAVKNRDRIHISHEYRDPRFAHKIQHTDSAAGDSDVPAANLNAPQLKKKEKEYLAKIEDALQNEEGSLLYTNSWAVQLHQAEVAQADRIADKHGFENMGQVCAGLPKILA